MRIAVMGVGSLGTVLGSMLARDGLDVELVDANPEHVEALNSQGARVEGLMEFTTPVKALTPDLMQGLYDLVIYLVKSTFDDTALPRIQSHMGPESALITLQNGVPEERVAAYIGRERTLGGAVGWAGEYLRPGVSALRSDPERMTYDIGELEGKTTNRIIKVKDVLDHAGTAVITENLLGTRWTKLLINVGISGISTALGSAGAEILDSDKAVTAIILLMIEAIKTSQALGIKLEPMQGVDPSFLLAAANENLDNVKNLLKIVFSSFGEAKASMLLDLEKGIPCEIEAINGYLYRMSREAGVATPVNDQITTMIRDIQDGKLRYDFSNLDRLELPDVAFYFT